MDCLAKLNFLISVTVALKKKTNLVLPGIHFCVFSERTNEGF